MKRSKSQKTAEVVMYCLFAGSAVGGVCSTIMGVAGIVGVRHRARKQKKLVNYNVRKHAHAVHN